jgi:hypothetical protein
METNDKIVDQVIEKFKSRSSAGIEKYGTTLYSNNADDFLNHAIEEAMDLTLYLTKVREILKSKGFNNLQELLNNIQESS